LKDVTKFKLGVEEIANFRDEIPAPIKPQTDPFINGVVLKGLLTAKSEALKADAANTGLQEQVNFIKTKLPEEEKKGF
jgi:hypothetical protein